MLYVVDETSTGIVTADVTAVRLGNWVMVFPIKLILYIF